MTVIRVTVHDHHAKWKVFTPEAVGTPMQLMVVMSVARRGLPMDKSRLQHLMFPLQLGNSVCCFLEASLVLGQFLYLCLVPLVVTVTGAVAIAVTIHPRDSVVSALLVRKTKTDETRFLIRLRARYL